VIRAHSDSLQALQLHIEYEGPVILSDFSVNYWSRPITSACSAPPSIIAC